MLIHKTLGDGGGWSGEGCLIRCFWCMQCSNPNGFQMLEEMSCVHLPLSEDLACIYQMLPSVARTNGKWQHIISFQWICTLLVGYYWVSFDPSRFCMFLCPVIFQTSFPNLCHPCSYCMRQQSWLTGRKRQKASWSPPSPVPCEQYSSCSHKSFIWLCW